MLRFCMSMVIIPKVGCELSLGAHELKSVADVSRALDTAFQYRNAFRKDIIVDLLVYRRWYDIRPSDEELVYDYDVRGHNELDEPAFTQPLMYHHIRSRKSVPTLYEDKLVVCSFH